VTLTFPTQGPAVWFGSRRTAVAILAFLALGGPLAAQTPDTTSQRPGWFFTPSASFGGSWENNVLLVNPANDPPSDYVSPLGVGLSLDYNGRRNRFTAGYDGSRVFYRSLDELNSHSHNLRALFEGRVSRRLTLFAQEIFMRAPSTDAIQLGGVPFYRLGTRLNTVRGGFDAAIARHTSLRGAYGLRAVAFDFDEHAVRELKGGHAHEVDASVSQALSPRLSVGVDYGIQRATIGEDEDHVTIQTGGATLDYRARPGLTVSGGLGLSRLGPSLQHEAQTGPAWRLSVTQQLEHAVLSAGYRRSFVPSFGFGGTFQNQELNGSAQLNFARNRAYVRASIGLNDADPLLEDELPLRTLWTSGTLGYAVTRWLRVEGFASQSRQDTDRPGGNLSRNRIGFQVVTAAPVKLQ
jgi:hypothetical protein